MKENKSGKLLKTHFQDFYLFGAKVKKEYSYYLFFLFFKFCLLIPTFSCKYWRKTNLPKRVQNTKKPNVKQSKIK